MVNITKSHSRRYLLYYIHSLKRNAERDFTIESSLSVYNNTLLDNLKDTKHISLVVYDDKSMNHWKEHLQEI